MSDRRFFSEVPEGVVVNVKAKPRSSISGIEGIEEEALKVRIRSAPVDGKANKELIETVAEHFGLPKSRVVFKSGESSKHKRLLLVGMSGAEFEARLRG